MDYVRCPHCLAEVDEQPAEIVCTACRSVFPRDREIPLFTENPDFFHSPTPREWLSGLLKLTQQEVLDDPSRMEILLQRIVDHIPDNAGKAIWIENLVDESRAVGKYLTAMQPEHHVLNLGCGWDNTTINMARTAERVTAIDLTRERVMLLALKKRYYGLDNIDLFCGGDTAHLPFADHSFDTVFINGALEWVASDWSRQVEECRGRGRVSRGLHYLRAVYTQHRPARIQRRFLGEVRRVLKETGDVFIGIENRYSREYIAGRPDHHSAIRFGSLYPRWLAHLVSLLTRHQPYLTFTHGIRGYASLLSRAGLPLKRTHALEPSYRRPVHLVDLSRGNDIRHFTRKRPVLRRMPAWFYRNTAPTFGLVGTSATEVRPWIERMVSDFSSRQDRGQCRLQSVSLNRKGKMSLIVSQQNSATGSWLLKVPVSPLARINCEAHFQALHHIHEHAGKDPELASLLQLIPRPVEQGSMDGQSWFAETLCGGQPWSDAVPEHGDPGLWHDLKRVLDLLGRLPKESLSAEQEMALFDEKLGLLGQQAGVEPVHRRALEMLREIIGAAVDQRAGNTFLRKGDFTLSNVMVSRGRISGLIDFDEWGATSDPLVDTADVLLSWWRHRRKRFWLEGLNLLGSLDRESIQTDPALQSLFDNIGATPEALARSALSAWLDHAYHACRHHHLRLNRRWVGRVVLDVLEALEARLGKDGRMHRIVER